MTKFLRNRIAITLLMLFAASIIMSNLSFAEKSNGAGGVNINEASVSELAALKGIGKVKAEAIVAYRRENGKFESVDDIHNVKGIGEKIIDKIRDRITFK